MRIGPLNISRAQPEGVKTPQEAGRPGPSDANTKKSGKGRNRNIKSAYPRVSPENTYDALDFVRDLAVSELHNSVLQRIRGRISAGAAARVTFVVNDPSKWNGDSLLAALAEAGFEVTILIATTDAKGVDRQTRARLHDENLRFFQRLGVPLAELYEPDSDSSLPIENFDTDIAFLQQPWGMRDFPRRLCGRALPAYMHYGFILMANHGMHYNIGTFHSYLWRYFTQTYRHKEMHIAHDPSAFSRIVVTGYPKLDVYLQPYSRLDIDYWAETPSDGKRIVFAPHHSLGKDNLRMGTFRWSGELMLRIARERPETSWVYKPHPNLKHSIVRNGVMTAEEYVAYESRWSSLANASVYDSGDYFELFRSSDALITDCGSFLAEYLPTGNPILWLVQAGTVGLNTVGAALSEGFYDIHSPTELEDVFHSVIIGGNDPAIDRRAELCEELFPLGRDKLSATAVVASLTSSLTERR